MTQTKHAQRSGETKRWAKAMAIGLETQLSRMSFQNASWMNCVTCAVDRAPPITASEER